MTSNFSFSSGLLKKIVLAILLDFGPIVLFLISYEIFHVYRAVFVLMIATIISTFVTFKIQKRLPYIALYVALITLIFGYVTIVYKNPNLIQIRDSLYDFTLALTLIFGLSFKKFLLRFSFESVLPMSDDAWRKLTNAWIVYFLAAGTVNEYIRRTQSFAFWIDYKTFIIFFTVAFGIITLLYFYEKKEEHKHEEQEVFDK